jgi:hypothetical protein
MTQIPALLTFQKVQGDDIHDDRDTRMYIRLEDAVRNDGVGISATP